MVQNKSMAKRAAPPEVKPVMVNGIEYTAVYEGVGSQTAACAVVARDQKLGKQVWKTVVYRIAYDKKKETDVQDVWPKTLALENEDLVLTNERNEVFRLNVTTGQIETHRAGPK